MRRIHLGLGIVAGALVSLLLIAKWKEAPPGSPRQEAAGLSAEVSALRREVASLRRDRAEVRVIQVPEPSSAANATQAPEASAAPRDDAEVEAPHELHDPIELVRKGNRETGDRLDARFSSEPVDTEWSLDTVRQIRAAFDEDDLATRIIEADCGSSLCRVLLAHDNLAAQQQLSSSIGRREPFSHGVFYDYDHTAGEAEPKTRLFIVRPGRSFKQASAPL